MNRFSNLRYRLLALVLVPLVLLTGTVILLASKWSTDFTYEQLFTKVNTDLRVAGESFQRILEDGQRDLIALAGSASLNLLLTQGSNAQLLNLLEAQRVQRGFDFLKLLSEDGKRVLVEAGWQTRELRSSPLTAQVMSSADMVDGAAGIEIYAASEWQMEPGIDAELVVLPLVDTARAAPTTRRNEDRAMIIRTLQPVVNADQRRVALLEGGLLLNRNFEFVDEIRDLVYGPGSLAPGSRGTVTVFLEDVRITTNVPARDDSRALGTRVSAEVRDTVLNRGEDWIDRAFVVNDWYISAYEPILDVAGNRVGMLYAGYLEAPFRSALFQAIAVMTALVVAGSLLAAVAAILGARSIFTPIEAMTSVVRATAAGEHRRIGPIPTGSEIGELASQIDAMLDTLELHRERIEKDAAMLEDKVQHRTAELEKQNKRLHDSIDLLHQTRQQLATAEKLAALGELTAGVAHEINNPTAVILGNMDVLTADLGKDADTVQTEIDLIIEQVYRIRSITDRLLQYSRSEVKSSSAQPDSPLNDSAISPGQHDLSPQSLEPVPLDAVVTDTLRLLLHELDGQNIVVEQRHHATRLANIGRQELQQVLVNLITNAIQAVIQKREFSVAPGAHDNALVQTETDVIEIDTADDSDDGVVITVRDSGCGIDASHLPRVFDPFFTSGKVQGTGLGLSVSYGIVRRFGGDIQVTSTVGHGSTFEIRLPGSLDTQVRNQNSDGVERLIG